MTRRATDHGKATLRSVASGAGVSIATASKALNDLPVSAENKAKVLEVAARLGYVVNETARALQSKRSSTVGLIFNELKSLRGIGLLEAMSASLESAGYSLLCATARSDATAYDTLARRFLERRVDGLFCVMPPAQIPSARLYAAAGIPIVLVTEQAESLQSQSLVRPSIDAAAGCALSAIVKLGHRRMLSLGDDLTNRSLSKIDPQWKRKIAIELMHLRDAHSLHGLAQELMRQQPRPTLICAPEAQAETLLAVCQALRIRVPEDLSIVAFTQSINEERAAQLDLASVYLRSELLGTQAATQMVALLSGARAEPRISVEVGSWTQRASVGPAPSAE